MKKINLLLLLITVVGLLTLQINAQSAGDFRSAASGNWGDASTWQTWNGSGWVAAASAPDSNITTAVTVLNPHNVTVAATVGVRNVTVNSGATVTVNGSPVTLYITQQGMTVNGTLTLTGDVATAAPYSIVPTTGSLIIGATGVVNYNQTNATTSTKGAIPSATWQAGSTLNVNSTGGIGATGWGSGGAQNFANINYNCPLQTGSFGWGFNQNTMSGNFSVLATNSGRLQFFGGSSGTLNIMGDFNVSGASNVTTNGTSSATNDTLSIYGKVNVNTTGNFSLSRGSQGGSGTAIINFYGDSVKIIAGTMQNSNTVADNTKFIFKKAGTTYLNITPTVVSSGLALPVEVSAGTTVSLTAPTYFTVLYLNGGIIQSTTANPLILGWWNGASISGGSISPTAPGSSTSYVIGPMQYFVAAASATTKVYPLGRNGAYRPLSLSVTPTTATMSTFTAELFSGPPAVNSMPGTLSKVSYVRYYKITEGAGGSAFTSGSVIINYDIDDNVTDAPNLRIAQGPASGGGTWVDLGGIGTGAGTGSITSTTAFTDLTNTVFVLANNITGNNPLPVELTSFAAVQSGRNIQLTWETKTELNSSRFEVERSVKGLGWVPAGSVLASGTTSAPHFYSFADRNVLTGKYQYRLKMIDNDGSFKYSNVTEIEISAPDKFGLSQNFPNPFNPATTIEFQMPETRNVTIKVYNIIGSEIATLLNEVKEAGIHSVKFDASNIPSGNYIYTIQAGNFRETRKMTLLK